MLIWNLEFSSSLWRYVWKIVKICPSHPGLRCYTFPFQRCTCISSQIITVPVQCLTKESQHQRRRLQIHQQCHDPCPPQRTAVLHHLQCLIRGCRRSPTRVKGQPGGTKGLWVCRLDECGNVCQRCKFKFCMFFSTLTFSWGSKEQHTQWRNI